MYKLLVLFLPIPNHVLLCLLELCVFLCVLRHGYKFLYLFQHLYKSVLSSVSSNSNHVLKPLLACRSVRCVMGASSCFYSVY